MQLKDIKQYIDWCQEGDKTISQRLEMFKRQKQKLEEQQKLLRQYMEKIDYKIAYYSEAAQKGNISEAQKNQCLAAEKERLFHHTK